MGVITANNDGKKLWGADNVVYFKSICAAYSIHYKDYRGGTVYNEETVDINDGVNTFTVKAEATRAHYLDIQFFDKDGNQFLPYNWEYLTKLKGDSGGNGLLTVFSDGTIRVVIENKLEDITAYNHPIKFVWDSLDEEIDNRKITIAFDFE